MRDALTHEKLTVTSGSAVKLGSQVSGGGGVPLSANRALIVVETAAVRWYDDGTHPTTTDGMPLAAGSVMDYDVADGLQSGATASTLEFIAQSATATVWVSYYTG